MAPADPGLDEQCMNKTCGADISPTNMGLLETCYPEGMGYQPGPGTLSHTTATGHFADCSKFRPISILGWIALLLLSVPNFALSDSRSLLYREINLAAVYSRRRENLDFHAMPPFSSVGFEYLWKFSDVKTGQLRPEALDLYLQFVYDPTDDRFEVRSQDLWVRFADPGSDLRVRLGYFALPFGLNPVAEPRGEVLQPLAAFDLGFKKDWGLAVQGKWHDFVCETAATLGTADEIHRRRGRYLLTGRLGVPTFRDTQYGISFLYGNIAKSGRSLQTSWRASADLIYMYNEPFTVFRGELTFGADDHTPVRGFLVGLTQILPSYPQWAIETQIRSWRQGLSPAAEHQDSKRHRPLALAARSADLAPPLAALFFV